MQKQITQLNLFHRFIPTPATLDSWYFMLQLMAHIHAIAAEPPAGAGSGEKEPPRKFGS